LFSRTLEYALRAAAHLALSAPEFVTAAEMAEATQVPAAYLSKVLQQLRDHGIVVTQRGIGGGMKLARPATELTILDIADAVEPIQRIRSCPLGISGHGVRLCPLHRRLDQAMAAIEQTFAESTLADLVEDKEGRSPLCPFPHNEV
jgi:Rrf2 family protein